MRVFSKKKLEKYVEERVQQAILKDRVAFMQGTANNAAKNALHYYTCFRTIQWWHDALDRAEKSGDKYMSLAQMFTEVQKENEEDTVS